MNPGGTGIPVCIILARDAPFEPDREASFAHISLKGNTIFVIIGSFDNWKLSEFLKFLESTLQGTIAVGSWIPDSAVHCLRSLSLQAGLAHLLLCYFEEPKTEEKEGHIAESSTGGLRFPDIWQELKSNQQ